MEGGGWLIVQLMMLIKCRGFPKRNKIDWHCFQVQGQIRDNVCKRKSYGNRIDISNWNYLCLYLCKFFYSLRYKFLSRFVKRNEWMLLNRFYFLLGHVSYTCFSCKVVSIMYIYIMCAFVNLQIVFLIYLWYLCL